MLLKLFWDMCQFIIAMLQFVQFFVIPLNACLASFFHHTCVVSYIINTDECNCVQMGGTRAFVSYYVTCLGGFFIAKLVFCLVFTLHVLSKIRFFYLYGEKVASHEKVFFQERKWKSWMLLTASKMTAVQENEITWYTFCFIILDFVLLTAHTSESLFKIKKTPS